jgi:hypothetical protein
MRRTTSCFALALAVAGASVPTVASAQISLFANLTTSAEPSVNGPTNSLTGAPRPMPFGTATFTLNPVGPEPSMSWIATIFNIDVTGSQTADANDNLTTAHIHGGASITPSASVIWGFFGTPFNDNAPKDVTLTPFASGVGGTFTGKWDAPEGNNTTLPAQLGNILNGRSYMNFHTVQNPGGEIRGTLVVVPEPATVVLTAAGLAMLALARRRRALRWPSQGARSLQP